MYTYLHQNFSAEQAYQKRAATDAGRLFHRHYQSLMCYGKRITGNDDLIKDCIQELFYALLKKRASSEKIHHERAYLFSSLRRIIVRQSIRQQRIEQLEQEYAMMRASEAGTYSDEIFPGFRTNPHHQDEERNPVLQAAVNVLSRRQKEAISLKYYEGLSNDEISTIMQINKQSVCNHLSVGVKRLQRFYEQRGKQAMHGAGSLIPIIHSPGPP